MPIHTALDDRQILCMSGELCRTTLHSRPQYTTYICTTYVVGSVLSSSTPATRERNKFGCGWLVELITELSRFNQWAIDTDYIVQHSINIVGPSLVIYEWNTKFLNHFRLFISNPRANFIHKTFHPSYCTWVVEEWLQCHYCDNIIMYRFTYIVCRPLIIIYKYICIKTYR